MLLFLAGIGVGLVLAALSFIVAMGWPVAERERPPVSYAAIAGNPHAVDTSNSDRFRNGVWPKR
jgi:hypothetical protein